ncbi:hypothetical protein CPY51_05615 [Rhizobium tubonense]|uniref:Uncharacterized protein n=1 Tax=Rhizobium tubonense TaxID=484088 RepID=A0A2W4F1W6_9HYPH|nr:hypothetical protein CPY51_05615 [Rhizobium tubonense]
MRPFRCGPIVSGPIDCHRGRDGRGPNTEKDYDNGNHRLFHRFRQRTKGLTADGVEGFQELLADIRTWEGGIREFLIVLYVQSEDRASPR